MSDRFKKAEANKLRDKALRAVGPAAEEARAAWVRVHGCIPKFEDRTNRNYVRRRIEREARRVMLTALADGKTIAQAEADAMGALTLFGESA